MSYYGSIQELPDGDLTYKNNCIDGKCSNCGECCTDLLPLSAEEVERLKAYARKHGLKEHTQAPFFAAGVTDLTCPFRNDVEGKCDVYEVRPKICRSFICTKTREQAKRDRDLLHQKRPTHYLRYEIFGNAKAGALLEQLTAFDKIMKG